MNPSNEETNQPESAAEVKPAAVAALEGTATTLVLVLDQYMADLRAGKGPDREELLARHPELAPQLRECLGGIEFIHKTSHLPDDTLSQLGDFRIEREIGRGGMGVVYEAEQISLRRRVALKVLRFGGVADAEAVQRFQREAETVAGLDHANIVPVYAVGVEDGVHYYAMQLIDGQSLADVAGQVQKRTSRGNRSRVSSDDCAGGTRTPTGLATPTMTAPLIAQWGLAAAEALSHAHQNGVVHRDVKPSNLILDEDGRLWLTDFGLARREIDTTLSVAGALLGTPRYMSPEQATATRRPVDHRTDIYSLGATLYELATGQPLFDADTPQGVISQILNAEPPAPRNLDPDLPRVLETIILKCLQKEAADRYATAADLAGDLQAFLEDRPIRARRLTLVERTMQLLKRHRRVATVAGASAMLAVILVAGVLLAFRSWKRSRLGEVEFTTSGPRMVGEILDANDRPVMSGFPVPTIERLKLPAGDYRVRLSADGLLSETWPLQVERGVQRSFEVHFRSRWLWPPKELDPSAHTEIDVVALEARAAKQSATGAGLLVLSYETDRASGKYRTRLRCIDGRTGRSAWPEDLVLNKDTAPDVPHAIEWSSMLYNPGIISDDFRRLVRPLADLDGDETRDLILVSRSKPSLLAVSGADGTVLWWYRARPLLPNDRPPTAGRWTTTSTGSVLGWPALADVDGDGSADVVACFLSAGETFRPESGKPIKSGRQCWIEAVSGRTGEQLWQSRLDAKLKRALSSSDRAKKAHIACLVGVVESGNHPVVVTVVQQKLIGLDLASGESAWEPYDLGFDPYRPPIYRDLDGDGSTDALFIRMHDDGDLESVAIPFAAGRPGKASWTKKFRPNNRDHDYRKYRDDWYAVDDLDGDGAQEIVTATGNFAAAAGAVFEANDRWCGVELIDAATGAARWQRRLARTGASVPPAVDRIVIGPDLDGDGHRDVFATWLPSGSYFPSRARVVRVVALSGRDGSTLWRWHHGVSGRRHSPDQSGPLTWWQPGPDGWPLLVVPLANARGGQHTTFFLSASTGRLEHTLSDVVAPNVADFNGDGVLDLFYRVAPQGSPRMLVMSGAPPEPWKRLGDWQPIVDINGDGVKDFLKHYSHTAVSGRDNRLLWQQNGSFDNDMMPLSPPASFGDLNDDGVPDIVGLASGGSVRSLQQYKSLVAISGRDGRLLWQGADFGMGNGGGGGGGPGWRWHWPASDWTDLDGDGCAEFLIAHWKHYTPPGQRSTYEEYLPHLTVLSGRDGRLKWQTPVAQGSVLGWPDPYGRRYEDLNGDGTGDILVWAPVNDRLASQNDVRETTGPVAGPEGVSSRDRPIRSPHQKPQSVLRAISGSDGSTLWTAADVATAENDWLWPRPAVGDLDGDGLPEVVAGRHKYESGRGHHNELFALDGRSGAVKWSHMWYGNPGILPPLLVDFDGDGRRSVCVALHEGHEKEIVIVDANGESKERIPLSIRGRLASRIHLWNYADVDGDGREELLFADDERLIASRGRAGKQLWSRALPDRNSALVMNRGFSVGRTSKSVQTSSDVGGASNVAQQTGTAAHHAELILWSGTRVYGLSGVTGDVVWRCDGNTEPQLGSSPPRIDLIDGPRPGMPPQVVFGGTSYLTGWATISRQAWPIDSAGRFHSPAPQPRDYEPLGEEPAAKQPLPWMNGRAPSLYQHLECLVFPSGLVSLAILIAPLWLIRRSLSPRARSGGTTSGTAGAESAAWTAAMALAACSAFFTLSSFAGLPSVLALIVPVVLLFRAVRHRRRADAVLGGVMLVAVLIPLIIVHYLLEHSMQDQHAWGRWWWLDEMVGEPLLVTIAGLPAVVFWWAVIRAARHRSRGAMCRLFGSATLLAALFAAVVLFMSSRGNPGASYSWNGWYVIWFWGAYAAGTLALLGAGIDRIAAWRRQRAQKQMEAGVSS